MPPVSMKMAKLQKATLDPTKISGRCGRLKCCLNYELEQYMQALKAFPKIDSQITNEQGRKGVVRKIDIFKKRIWVVYKDNSWEDLPLDVIQHLKVESARNPLDLQKNRRID